MAFKVKARVLLELGAELISSDGVALYELIKNSIDAGSEDVEVRVAVALTASGHRALRQSLKGFGSAQLSPEYVTSAVNQYFDPAARRELREEFQSLLANRTAVAAIKLADQFFQKHTYIEVEDWGCGMSAADMEKLYLTVGTPNRAQERLAAPIGGSRPILGEKGIGRLSAMRLGSNTQVISGKLGESNWSVLDIDWDALRDIDMDIEGFAVEPVLGGAKNADDEGTQIRISGIQSDWSSLTLALLAKSELSKLEDPFDRAAEKLGLSLFFNGEPVSAIEELDRRWLKTWHGFFWMRFGYKKMVNGDREPYLLGVAKFRVPEDARGSGPDTDVAVISESGAPLKSLLASVQVSTSSDGTQNASSRFDGIMSLGPFNARGYWFNRQRSKKEIPKEQHSGFQRWLSQWAGGLLLFRDGYRVYPYAAPDDDWLELDQKALKRRSFKLNRGQFVGRVRISSRRNPSLKDQTNRQGLCDSPEKRVLIQCLQHVIWKELGSLVSSYEKKSSTQALSSVKEIGDRVREKSKDAKASLRQLAKRAPQEAETIAALRGHVEDLELAWARAKNTLKKQAAQADTYLHLAGVGMLLEFVVHELNRVTSNTLADLKTVPEAKLPPSLRSLGRQLQTLDKRLRILDPVSTPGRQTKETTAIGDVLETLVDAHEQQFLRHHIDCVVSGSGELDAHVVAGQMYQIFENLISNSVYWLTNKRAVETDSGMIPARGVITITVDEATRTVVFEDDGPGIDAHDRKKVFEPFYSKKPSGRGIGLYIVKNLCEENGIVVAPLDSVDGRFHGFEFKFP